MNLNHSSYCDHHLETGNVNDPLSNKSFAKILPSDNENRTFVDLEDITISTHNTNKTLRVIDGVIVENNGSEGTSSTSISYLVDFRPLSNPEFSSPMQLTKPLMIILDTSYVNPDIRCQQTRMVSVWMEIKMASNTIPLPPVWRSCRFTHHKATILKISIKPV